MPMRIHSPKVIVCAEVTVIVNHPHRASNVLFVILIIVFFF